MSFIKEYFGDVIGGGKMEETALWTNSAPTSTFAAQTITLSDDIDNYDYLRFYVRLSTSNAKSNSIFISVNDFKNTGNAANSLNLAHSCYYEVSSIRNRHFYYVSDTSIGFGTCFNSGNTGSDNTYLIPTKISGVKLVKGPVNVKIGTFQVNSSSAVTVPVGFKAKQIAIVFQGKSGTATSAANGSIRIIYDERISETYIHRGYKNPSGVVAVTSESMSTSDIVRLYDVDDNGFKFIVPNSATGNYGTYLYFAIG